MTQTIQMSFDKSEMFLFPFKKIVLKFYFTSMNVLAVCMSVYYVHAWFPKKPETDLGLMELLVKTAMSYHIGARNQT